jgi:cadmium resistance protein CadD (predicted permease)
MSLLLVGGAALAFAATNVDDLVVLTALVGAGLRRVDVVAGQYAGVGALVAVSVVASLGLLVVPDRWVALLGLVPLGLGVRGLVRAARRSGADAAPVATVRSWWGVAALVVTNGADNVGVYTPVFRQLGGAATAVYVGVFAVGVAVWCAVGTLLAGRAPVVRLLERAGHWLVPAVFVAVGVLVLASGLG